MAAKHEKTVYVGQKKVVKVILAFINISLILFAIIFSLSYSDNLRKAQKEQELDTFCATIDSMKQISVNYLTMEQGYAKDWSKYISSHDMTVEEALDYINQANNQTDRYAHIVDMTSFEAYSTYKKDGSDKVSCYKIFSKEQNDTDVILMENMRQMYEKNLDRLAILSKYRADDTQLNVTSVGTNVTLVSPTGEKKDYLLLRVIPIESIRKIWVFPIEYMSAEVGIITKSGDYVVPSKSMRSRSFADFIRGYNFENDYNQVDVLVARLQDTDSGIMEYVDSKGEECYWYYSSLDEQSGLDILGYIPVENLNTHKMNWNIVIVTCGVLALLVIIDGAYILHINRRLRETAELAEEASKAKTTFLSTMSHDIRTPMNGIIGMLNLAKLHLNDTEYVKNCLNKMSLAGDQLLMLINDILDISKVESGNMAINPAVFSVEALVDKLVDITWTQMQEKKITLDVVKEIPHNYLIADELRVNQVFLNVLNNAVKYTPDGGNVKMTVTEELLPDNRVRLIYCVSDTGIGMSEEFQGNMYNMFARGMDSRINKTQGTGLGLAIVKQMVELMGGNITCESALGKGTTFTIAIDLAQGDEQEYKHRNNMDESNAGEDTFENIHVLVAEDNELNWEIISEILKGFGVNSDRVKDGKECVERMNASADGAYDLILMDIQMPVMDGREATRIIRANTREYVKNITIVAMTADAFAEDVQNCMNAGMDGHIPKPIDMKRVVEVLRQVQQKKKEKIS